MASGPHQSSLARLSQSSKVSALVALALALVGGGLFWRLRAVVGDGSIVVGDRELVFNVLLPFLVLSLGCLIISLVSVILASRQDRIITGERDRVEATEQMADLVAKLDDERMQSFSSWLHDSLGHGLVLLKMDIEHQVSEGRFSAPAAADAVAHLDSMLAEVRGMSASLYPRVLSEVGLRAALDALLGYYRKMSHLEVDSAIGELPSTARDGAKAFAVYRTVQECLTNAAKHGNSEFVWVAVREAGGRVHGTVLNHVGRGGAQDAGAGADPIACGGRGGIGLELMALRLRRIGGSLSFGWDGEGVFKVDFEA